MSMDLQGTTAAVDLVEQTADEHVALQPSTVADCCALPQQPEEGAALQTTAPDSLVGLQQMKLEPSEEDTNFSASVGNAAVTEERLRRAQEQQHKIEQLAKGALNADEREEVEKLESQAIDATLDALSEHFVQRSQNITPTVEIPSPWEALEKVHVVHFSGNKKHNVQPETSQELTHVSAGNFLAGSEGFTAKTADIPFSSQSGVLLQAPYEPYFASALQNKQKSLLQQQQRQKEFARRVRVLQQQGHNVGQDYSDDIKCILAQHNSALRQSLERQYHVPFAQFEQQVLTSRQNNGLTTLMLVSSQEMANQAMQRQQEQRHKAQVAAEQRRRLAEVQQAKTREQQQMPPADFYDEQPPYLPPYDDYDDMPPQEAMQGYAEPIHQMAELQPRGEERAYSGAQERPLLYMQDGNPASLPEQINPRYLASTKVFLPRGRRTLEQNDFLRMAAKRDAWTEFVMDNFQSQGFFFNFMVKSERFIDPVDPNHWILSITKEDSPVGLNVDIDVWKEIQDKIESVLQHKITLEVQYVSELPKRSPDMLSRYCRQESLEQARERLLKIPRLRQLMKKLDEDLTTVGLELFTPIGKVEI